MSDRHSDKIGAYAAVILIALWSILWLPAFTRFHNPPFHYYGGFDYPAWIKGMLIYTFDLIALGIMLRRGIGRRWFTIAMSVLVCGAVAVMLFTLYTALGEPTV